MITQALVAHSINIGVKKKTAELEQMVSILSTSHRTKEVNNLNDLMQSENRFA